MYKYKRTLRRLKRVFNENKCVIISQFIVIAHGVKIELKSPFKMRMGIPNLKPRGPTAVRLLKRDIRLLGYCSETKMHWPIGYVIQGFIKMNM